jgi:hypothetical protein
MRAWGLHPFIDMTAIALSTDRAMGLRQADDTWTGAMRPGRCDARTPSTIDPGRPMDLNVFPGEL